MPSRVSQSGVAPDGEPKARGLVNTKSLAGAVVSTAVMGGVVAAPAMASIKEYYSGRPLPNHGEWAPVAYPPGFQTAHNLGGGFGLRSACERARSYFAPSPSGPFHCGYSGNSAYSYYKSGGGYSYTYAQGHCWKGTHGSVNSLIRCWAHATHIS